MRALITGVDGFVGHHLRDYLVQCGDDVVGVDRNCDVTNFDSVLRVIEANKPEVVFHLAALTHVGESWVNPKEFTRVNVLGTRNTLEATCQAAPSAGVLLVSSADVYGVVGEGELPLSETNRAVPANPYAQSKLEAELLAKRLARETGQRIVIARPFNHIGPGQSDRFVIPAIVNRLLEATEQGADEIVVGDLSTRRDFCDVRDVVRAYRLMMQLGVSGEIYNVASGHDVALIDIANDLVAQISPSVHLTPDASLFRPVETPILRGSFEKLHDATGWEPSISLATSLSDVIADMRSRRISDRHSS